MAHNANTANAVNVNVGTVHVHKRNGLSKVPTLTL
jgi:hypothetical protein